MNWSNIVHSTKIILAYKHTDYQSALMYFSIDTLSNRRQTKTNMFAIKCIQDENNQRLFPRNVNVKGKGVYHVNFPRTSQYLKSTIPQCQRYLNTLQNRTLNSKSDWSPHFYNFRAASGTLLQTASDSLFAGCFWLTFCSPPTLDMQLFPTPPI